MKEVYSTQLAIASGVIIFIIVVAFALVQSPALLDLGTAARETPYVPHPVNGEDRCSSCHRVGGTRPYPLKHLGWNDRSCLECHGMKVAPSAVAGPVRELAHGHERAGTAVTVPHAIEGMRACTGCHGEGGLRAYPPSHAGWADDGCLLCHAHPGAD